MPSYGHAFYNAIRGGCVSSGAAIAPVVHELVEPSTVVDVGCGEGWIGQAFADLGAAVCGYDTGNVLQAAPDVDRHHRDLRKPLPIPPARFDLAVCLEVAEHLPAARAPGLVEDLCALAPVVLFSAAVPGQGGTGHITLRWPEFWHGLFAESGFRCSWALRFRFWADKRVEPWYKNNLVLATDDPERFPGLFDTDLAHPWPVLHPDLYITR